jgi:ubiquinone/menaquinone biosynthesis C-methylase UbiE
MSTPSAPRTSEIERQLEPEVMDTDLEVANYKAMDHTGPNTAFVDRLVELGASGRALDIGCGPGHIPLLAVERIPDLEVVALDASPRMLAEARALVAASPHAARITLEEGDAKWVDHEDESFDVVFSNTILHHIPDPTHLLIEAARLLRPGGTLLIRDLFRPATEAELERLVALHAADESDYNRGLFAASLRAALTLEEVELCAEAAFLGGAELVVDSDRHFSLQLRAGTWE